MGRIDQETVQRILDAADIVDVVSDFVKLRRSGANYKGLCPFHNERTPSFSVNKARNICKCFSCGKGGSPVNFIMEHEQMSFQEALRYLARKYNIEIVEREMSDAERQQQSRREALLAVNAFALERFEHNLRHTDDGRDIAMAYVRHRGISDAMVERFHLGYAIDKGTAFLAEAREAGFSDEFLVESGLEVRSDRDGALYDRYRGRVIFPIHSLSGRVVGFGARTMRSDKNIAKYVNSPESEIYHKKRELYGLFQARSAIGRRDKCIIVEGYLDVISMHQAGVENVVASSGTSLTEEQCRTIHRFTENVTLIYDADAAGIKASMRGINLLLAEKMNVKVLALPEGDDPDSFAQKHSASEVEDYLARNEIDIIAFMVGKLMAGVSPDDPMARAKVINEILATVAYVDEVVKRQEYLSMCSRLLGVAEEVLVNQLRLFVARRYENAEKSKRSEEAQASISDIETADTTDTSTPLLDLANAPLKPYEENIMRYVVRYGLLMYFEVSHEDGSSEPATVFDIIDLQFKAFGYEFSYPPFVEVFETMRGIRGGGWMHDRERRAAEIEAEAAALAEKMRDELRINGCTMDRMQKEESRIAAEVDGFRSRSIDEYDISYAQSRLLNTDNDVVREVASALLLERYTLSKMYTRNTGLETEQDQLCQLVPRAIREFKGAVVELKLKELTRKLMETPPTDAVTADALMDEIARWKKEQLELGKALGERIIVPRR